MTVAVESRHVCHKSPTDAHWWRVSDPEAGRRMTQTCKHCHEERTLRVPRRTVRDGLGIRPNGPPVDVLRYRYRRGEEGCVED
jgi:hypothetical protein